MIITIYHTFLTLSKICSYYCEGEAFSAELMIAGNLRKVKMLRPYGITHSNFVKMVSIVAVCVFIISTKAFSENKVLSLSDKTEEIIGTDFINPHQLKYTPIIPQSEEIYLDNSLLLRDADYTIDYNLGQIDIKKEIKPDSVIKIHYRIIPITLQKSYQRKIFESQIQKEPVLEAKEKKSTTTEMEIPPSELTFTGTKTLSLSMESLRGLTINQPTRLNINGTIAGNINVSALLSDEDLPLQPEGTTEELEDLDKILIKIEGKNLSATLGDYETSFGDTEFVLAPKQLEGAQAQGNFNFGGFTLIGAVSKGQSSSITISGIEGQNEYRVSVNGRYIVMIAGSEQVWLNGEKMRREKDYVIRDYGDPIIEFTKSHLITGKDIIVVDFEYIDEDRNYGQKLYGVRSRYSGYKTQDAEHRIQDGRYRENENLAELKFFGLESTFGASYAIESDDKNNPIMPLNETDINNLRKNILDPDGDGVLLPAPTSSSVIGFDGRVNIADNTFLTGEFALNKRDLNTFSMFDKIEEGKAWKLDGTSNTDRLRLNFGVRRFDSNFVPIGATLDSRSRGTYQKDYDTIGFGGYKPISKSGGEESYNMDIWLEPLNKIEFRGNIGRASNEYKVPELSKSRTDHWSRGVKISLPNLPQIDTRYQEATTSTNNIGDIKRTRELWQLDHRIFKIVNIRMRGEDFKSLEFDTSNNHLKRQERKITLNLPSYKNLSISSDLSLEKEWKSDHNNWIRSSTAQTALLNLSAKPIDWLDFNGYFGRRRLNRENESDIRTNVADLKLNIKQLRINYQIDKKLSTEKEEQYLNYIIVLADGKETIRYLKPGEGSYVKIDEYTYREDPEKGDYVRVLRTISDRPVTSLVFQSVFSIRPRFFYRQRRDDKSIKSQLISALSMFELGTRINEEQSDVTRDFYILRDLHIDKTIYGIKKFWCRMQLSPTRRISLTSDYEISDNLNRRLNSQTREIDSDRWKVKLDIPLTEKLGCGGELGKDDTYEKISSIPIKSSVAKVISDISEKQKFHSIFLNYDLTGAISKLELKASYETEWNDDATDNDLPVLTKLYSIGTEIISSFKGKGNASARYAIAKGVSSGKLPFTRYDFYEGISHKIKLEGRYRVKWFTDVTLRMTYRGEFAERTKPDHRFETEAVANF